MGYKGLRKAVSHPDRAASGLEVEVEVGMGMGWTEGQGVEPPSDTARTHTGCVEPRQLLPPRACA